MKLSEYVKNYRTSHKLSLRAFAEKCGCSHQYISRLESEQIATPSFKLLKQIATGMGISLHELMKRVDDIQISLLYDDILSGEGIIPEQQTSNLDQTYARLNEYNKQVLEMMAETLLARQEKEGMP